MTPTPVGTFLDRGPKGFDDQIIINEKYLSSCTTLKNCTILNSFTGTRLGRGFAVLINIFDL
jgi:hypothetical protein